MIHRLIDRPQGLATNYKSCNRSVVLSFVRPHRRLDMANLIMDQWIRKPSRSSSEFPKRVLLMSFCRN